MLGFDALAKLPLAALPEDGASATVTLDHATLSFAGQSIAFNTANALGVGALSFAGQQIASAITQRLDQGTLTYAGQSIVFLTRLVLDNAAIAFAGQTFPLDRSVPLGSTTITFVGQGEVPFVTSRRPFYGTRNSARMKTLWKGRAH